MNPLRLPLTLAAFNEKLEQLKRDGDYGPGIDVEDIAGAAFFHEDGTLGFHMIVKLTNGVTFAMDTVEHIDAAMLVSTEDLARVLH